MREECFFSFASKRNLCSNKKVLLLVKVVQSVLDHFVKGNHNGYRWSCPSDSSPCSTKHPSHPSVPKQKPDMDLKFSTFRLSKKEKSLLLRLLLIWVITILIYSYLQISAKVCLVVIFMALSAFFCKNQKHL